VTSLAETADRIVVGEDPLAAVRDFLDVIGRAPANEIAALITERPQPTGDARIDALLAGLAEHMSVIRDIACPRWVYEPIRFLDQFWFVSRVPGFRAMAIAQTPIALKRRGVFWPARSLGRI
jgi:hypothetical protein